MQVAFLLTEDVKQNLAFCIVVVNERQHFTGGLTHVNVEFLMFKCSIEEVKIHTR